MGAVFLRWKRVVEMEIAIVPFSFPFIGQAFSNAHQLVHELVKGSGNGGSVLSWIMCAVIYARRRDGDGV